MEGGCRRLRRPPCAASYPQGIAPPTSTEFHALPRIAALEPHTSGHAPSPHRPFIGVKAVAAACGLFAAARGCARHPRSQQLHEQHGIGMNGYAAVLVREAPPRAKTLAGFSAPRSAVKAASTVPASRSPGASAISWRRRPRPTTSSSNDGPLSSCPSFPALAGRGQTEDRHAIQGRQGALGEGDSPGYRHRCRPRGRVIAREIVNFAATAAPSSACGCRHSTMRPFGRHWASCGLRPRRFRCTTRRWRAPVRIGSWA